MPDATYGVCFATTSVCLYGIGNLNEIDSVYGSWVEQSPLGQTNPSFDSPQITSSAEYGISSNTLYAGAANTPDFSLFFWRFQATDDKSKLQTGDTIDIWAIDGSWNTLNP